MTLDEKVDLVLSLVQEIKEKVIAAPIQAASKVADVASDSDLDSKYGDPEIRYDPKRWDGPSFKGKKYSDASPEYLDELASFKDWAAGKDASLGTAEGDKKAHYSKLDASRARGWAARKRAGWKSTKIADAFDPDVNGDFPF